MWTASAPLKCNQLQHVAGSCARVPKFLKVTLSWRPARKAAGMGNILGGCESP